MTGRELIGWIEGNDALDLEIMADCGKEFLGCTVTRGIFPEVFDVAGHGVAENTERVYTVMTGSGTSEKVVVI